MAQARPSSRSPYPLPVRKQRPTLSSLTCLGLAILLTLSGSGCASSHGHAHSQAELSHEDSAPDHPHQHQSEEDDEPDVDEPSPASEEVTATSDDLAPAEDEAAPPPPAPEYDVARTALHRIPEAGNHLGLVLAVAVRTADLPWVLALENRSPHDLTLAALPALIHLDITPPGVTPTDNEVAATDPKGQPGTASNARKVTCGVPLPSKLEEADTLTLPAGALLVHAFDPSVLCSDTSIFVQDATVQLTYGFPTQTKKIWRKGGFTEQPIEQTAPFLAERLDNGQEPVLGLKHLVSEPLVLGRTYPLTQVTARPPSSSPQTEAPAAGHETTAPVSALAGEPPPLRVTIQPLGSAEKPEMGLVNVTITNSSPRSVLVHLRREYLTYEVTGPDGSLTCQMLPSALSAGTISYTSIAPGASVSVATRLAEACPPGTFGQPGRYTVAVRFAPESIGEERNANAYVGSIDGTRVVTLLVPGPQPSALPYMKVLPAGGQ
jgi:hypothetical protein